MATTLTGSNLISFPISKTVAAAPTAAVSRRRARKISPEAGRGIEILGHAIEYLADEFALDCLSPEARAVSEPGKHPRMAAIELLMSINRQIYLNCPEIPTFGERLRSWLRYGNRSQRA